MNVLTQASPRPALDYPDSDGQPMADNTVQARWIVTLFGNLAALFRLRLDVFVAMDLLWYPVEHDRDRRAAPDVLVVFGRPKGDRGSYRQWEEGDVPVTVAFEILSPGNTFQEMEYKLDFYDDHGVEEYYVYNPETNHLVGYVRSGTAFLKVRPIRDHVSPRLGIRFDLSGPEMVVLRPDGKPFLTFEELEAERQQLTERADKEKQRADDTQLQMLRLAELTRKSLLGQATPAERSELEQLVATLLAAPTPSTPEAPTP